MSQTLPEWFNRAPTGTWDSNVQNSKSDGTIVTHTSLVSFQFFSHFLLLHLHLARERYLLGHSRSEILLESKMAESCQYLVRVTSSLASAPSSPLDVEVDGEDDVEEEDDSISQTAEQKKILEYWWSLSRCKSGEYTGSYMVDAVIPNQM